MHFYLSLDDTNIMDDLCIKHTLNTTIVLGLAFVVDSMLLSFTLGKE